MAFKYIVIVCIYLESDQLREKMIQEQCGSYYFDFELGKSVVFFFFDPYSQHFKSNYMSCR